MMNLATSAGDITAGRVLDARGNGTDRDASLADNERVFTFSQFMVKMGGTFPLRGMQQVAVIGGGNSGLCAAESALGIAPGNTSVTGLDYVSQVDLYATTIDGRTCSAFRSAQRGRYIRLAQFLDGNASNPSTRLRVMDQSGYASALPGGVLVNDRTYDMAVLCTGYKRPRLPGDELAYFSVTSSGIDGGGSVLAKAGTPFESYRIGVAADIPFSSAEFDSGIASIPANQVSMFRNGPRTAALAAMLPAVGKER
jgi:hypothetical protein